jgi:hypothetical protein
VLHSLQHLHAAEVGHLHVQENEVDVSTAAQGRHGFSAVAALASDGKVGSPGQQLPNTAAGQGFIIDQQGANGFHKRTRRG